jgi:DNA-binding transcriptional LysR family regulator
VPRLLVQDELARGQLVLACADTPPGERAYYLISPERGEARPAMRAFSHWLQAAILDGNAPLAPTPDAAEGPVLS